MYVSLNWIFIGSDNALSPVTCQAITERNIDILGMYCIRTLALEEDISDMDE